MTGVNKLLESSRLENYLFSFTRILALGVSLVALVVIAVLAIGVIGGSPDKSYVSIDEVLPQTQSDQTGTGLAGTTASPKVKAPALVMKYLSGDNEKILHGWLEGLDEGQQKIFLDNLSSIISEAESKKADVIEVINKYKAVKLEKLQANPFDKYEQMATNGARIGTIFGMVILVGLMSLILVVLAIERNTRKAATVDDQPLMPTVATADTPAPSYEHPPEDNVPA